MKTLPVELRRGILEHLPIQDLKHVRLASKSWAYLGEAYLISPLFTTLPHRPDTQRLSSISLHPSYAHRIQTLFFNHGELNEYSGRHNSYFLQYLMEPEARLEQQYETWEAYAGFKMLKERFLPDSCDEDLLKDIFGRLRNLRSIAISLMTCPFPENDPRVPELLRNIWVFPSTRLLNRVATVERMSSILNAVAANSSTLTITSLSHDRLPFEFFVQNKTKMAIISTAFRSLTSLSLALEYSDMPNNMHSDLAFANLVKCIQAAPLLRHLELAMQGRRKIDIHPLLSLFAASEDAFPHLQSVKLQGVITTEEELGDFLVARKESLMQVQIGGEGVRSSRQPSNGGVILEKGSWRGLVGRLREEMSGVRVMGQGDLRGLETGETWVFDEAVEMGEAIGGGGGGIGGGSLDGLWEGGEEGVVEG